MRSVPNTRTEIGKMDIYVFCALLEIAYIAEGIRA